jgi:hypothetical protein
MKSKEQQNEYLKSVVIPQNLKQKRGTIAPRTTNFKYFAQFCDENSQNLISRKKVCKTAFLMLHRIKESRLRKKICRNHSDSEDKRRKHNSHYKIPLEVEEDI